MTFQMHHRIVLPYPYETVYPTLSSSKEFERLQRLTPFVQTFDLLPCDFVDPITSLPEQDPASFPRPIDLKPTSNANAQERINFEFTGQTLFQAAVVSGSQIVLPHLRAVLFESQVKKSGIRELKLRVCTSIEGGKMTEVEETVWGTAPALLARFLSWTGLAAKTHR
jgi:hypothetical protein